MPEPAAVHTSQADLQPALLTTSQPALRQRRLPKIQESNQTEIGRQVRGDNKRQEVQLDLPRPAASHPPDSRRRNPRPRPQRTGRVRTTPCRARPTGTTTEETEAGDSVRFDDEFDRNELGGRASLDLYAENNVKPRSVGRWGKYLGLIVRIQRERCAVIAGGGGGPESARTTNYSYPHLAPRTIQGRF